jgi:hypothetical protein
MSVVSGDIKFYLTPTGNTAPAASLGGSGQGSEISAVALHNIFDRVSAAEAAAGDVEYRAIDAKNTNATDTLLDAVVYLVETSSADTTVAIAYDSTGTQSIVNESTAPVGLSFSTPVTAGTGIALGDMAAGATKRIWMRRTVTGGAAKATDTGSITVSGGTA